MLEAPIVEETHSVRREIAAEFNNDVHAFFKHLRDREAERPDQVVILEPVAPEFTIPRK
jgi:hypothetical protein